MSTQEAKKARLKDLFAAGQSPGLPPATRKARAPRASVSAAPAHVIHIDAGAATLLIAGVDIYKQPAAAVPAHDALAAAQKAWISAAIDQWVAIFAVFDPLAGIELARRPPCSPDACSKVANS
jgi:hypothetical protein